MKVTVELMLAEAYAWKRIASEIKPKDLSTRLALVAINNAVEKAIQKQKEEN